MLGVEPAGNVAEAASAKGIRTVVEFLGPDTGAAIAAEYGQADLVAANNVFAHVPDIRGFAAGLRALVKDSGLVTLEFPHLLRLIERRQYDTIYHEHFSYLSLLTSSRALETGGLRVVDVEELSTHGGSLRVHARPAEAAGEPAERVKAVLDAEEAAGLHTVAGHEGFAGEVLRIKSDLLTFLIARCGRGQDGGGLRRAGQGQHAAEPLRDQVRPAPVHRGPVAGEAGQVPAGHAHPHLRTRPPGRDEAGLHPRAAVEPARGDQRAAVLRALLGRAAGLPDSRRSKSSEWLQRISAACRRSSDRGA